MSWNAFEMTHEEYEALPPDTTPSSGPICEARDTEGFVCTRGEGHTGRHAAGNSRHIVAVWG